MWEHKGIHEPEEISKGFAKALVKATIKHILILIGQRFTPASISDERVIPPTKTELIKVAMIEN